MRSDTHGEAAASRRVFEGIARRRRSPAPTSRPGGRRRPGIPLRLARRRGPRRLSLYWRVLLVNAIVLVAATLALALTPATIPYPLGAKEAGVVLGGLIVMVVANAVLLRLTFGPLARLVRLMRTIDLLRPGQRLPVGGGAEVRTVIQAFNEMLERLEEERRRSSSRALTAQEAERRRIGNELHDEIGQRLTGILLQLRRAVAAAPEEIRPYLVEAQEEARATIDEVGRLAWQLRPGILDDLGLVRAVEALATTFEEHSATRVVRRLDPRAGGLGADVELAVYRIAQESLTNVMRHAGASQVELVLERTERRVRLLVADDGNGRLADELASSGIRGMRERALQIGADLSIEAQPGRGVTVELDVPAP
jgi:two-component system sensor histidine kinase UhpB